MKINNEEKWNENEERKKMKIIMKINENNVKKMIMKMKW